MVASLIPALIFQDPSQFTFMVVFFQAAYDPICPIPEARGKVINAISCLEGKPGFSDLKQMYLDSRQPIMPPVNNYRLVKELCTIRPKAAEECIEEMMHNLTNCIEPKHYKGIEVWKKIKTEVSADYVCKNNSEVAYNIFEKTENTCWKTGVDDTWKKCIAEVNITASFYDISGLVRECKKIDEFKSCMMKNLPKVCPQNVVDSAEPIFQIVANNLCRDTNVIIKE